MIIDTVTTPTQVNTKTAGSSMTVNLSNNVLNILLDNLYTFPHRAIVRELSSNAVDAHKAAKNKDNFKIQVPSKFNPTFILRDYGTGLDAEEINKYLNTLYSGSKGESQDFIGGFGLGSKSPFALVDSFHISSFKDGIEHKCFWYRDSQRVPVLNILSSKESTEPNGIKFVIDFADKDVEGIIKACVTELITMNIRPKFYSDIEDESTEFDLFRDNSLEIVKDTDEYMILKDSNRILMNSSNLSVSMGGVHYDLLSGTGQYYIKDRLKYSNLATYVRHDCKFIAKLPIGTVSLPSTREHILNTDENKTAINDGLVKTLDIFLDEMLKEFEHISKDIDMTSATEVLSVFLPFVRSHGIRPLDSLQLFLPEHEKIELDGIYKELKDSFNSVRYKTAKFTFKTLLGSTVTVTDPKEKGYGSSGLLTIYEMPRINKSTLRVGSRYDCLSNLLSYNSKTLLIVNDTKRFMTSWIKSEEEYEDTQASIYKVTVDPSFSTEAVYKVINELSSLYSDNRVMKASGLTKPEEVTPKSTSVAPAVIPGIRTVRLLTFYESYLNCQTIPKLKDSKDKYVQFGLEYVKDIKTPVYYKISGTSTGGIALINYIKSFGTDDVVCYSVNQSQEAQFLAAFKSHPSGIVPIKVDTLNVDDLSHLDTTPLTQFYILSEIFNFTSDIELRKLLISSQNFDQLNSKSIEAYLSYGTVYLTSVLEDSHLKTLLAYKYSSSINSLLEKYKTEVTPETLLNSIDDAKLKQVFIQNVSKSSILYSIYNILSTKGLLTNVN